MRDKVQTIDGTPDGGEVAREALAGRAATILSGKINLDLDMPETHVVKLPAGVFPARPAGAIEDDVTCSVQEAKANKGGVKDMTPETLAAVPASQCASVAILDLVTLNTDRHGGNLLIGEDGGLVPIDHGCAFPQDSEAGRERIRRTMAGPHNALLRLPGTHQPMTEEMAAGVRSLDPVEIVGSLESEHDEVGEQHDSMIWLVDAESLVMTAKSTRFLKVAGGIKSGKLRLSPAAVQVAFAANSDELLDLALLSADDRKAFDKRATEILKQTLADQPVIEQACLLEDSAWNMIRSKLDKLGWEAQQRNDSPQAGLGTDPALCTRLIAGEIRCPASRDRKSLPAARLAAKGVRANAKAMVTAVVDVEIDALEAFATQLLQVQRARALATLRRDDAALRADRGLHRKRTNEMTTQALDARSDRWADMQANYAMDPGDFRIGAVAPALAHKNCIEARARLDEVQEMIDKDQIPAAPRAAPAAAAQGT